jgi:hypothetical protein
MIVLQQNVDNSNQPGYYRKILLTKDPENYMRNAKRTNKSNGKESISQRKDVYPSKIRFILSYIKCMKYGDSGMA